MRRLEIDTTPGAGRPFLLVALVVAALVITTVWYREGVDGPIHVARRVVLAASTPAAVAGTVITSPFRAAASYLRDSGVSHDQYVALKRQNEQLKATLAQLEETRQECDRVLALIDITRAQDYKTIGARVIGRPTESWERSMLIDRGTRDGVSAGAPVIAAGGLLGQVIDVTYASAKVRLITAVDSGVAVLVQRTRAEGLVRGSVDGKLTLDLVTKTPLPGDVLVTSGMGKVFPKGLVVGDVEHVAASQGGLYPTVDVVSRVAVDSIEEVVVIVGSVAEPAAGANE